VALAAVKLMAFDSSHSVFCYRKLRLAALNVIQGFSKGFSTRLRCLSSGGGRLSRPVSLLLFAASTNCDITGLTLVFLLLNVFFSPRRSQPQNYRQVPRAAEEGENAGRMTDGVCVRPDTAGWISR
jgi:hypothetical protein